MGRHRHEPDSYLSDIGIALFALALFVGVLVLGGIWMGHA